MKKVLVSLVLFWFFSLQHEISVPGASVLYIVGPFPSKQACEEERTSAFENMSYKPGFKGYECVEKKGA